jgi:hypothetical protein
MLWIEATENRAELSACIQLGIMSEITTMLATLLFQSEFRHQPATLLIQCWQHN